MHASSSRDTVMKNRSHILCTLKRASWNTKKKSITQARLSSFSLDRPWMKPLMRRKAIFTYLTMQTCQSWRPVIFTAQLGCFHLPLFSSGSATIKHCSINIVSSHSHPGLCCIREWVLQQAWWYSTWKGVKTCERMVCLV